MRYMHLSQKAIDDATILLEESCKHRFPSTSLSWKKPLGEKLEDIKEKEEDETDEKERTGKSKSLEEYDRNGHSKKLTHCAH